MTTTTEEVTTMTTTELADAAMHHTFEGFVSYRDTGTSLYLAWSADHPQTIHIISDDNRRTLGEIPTEARTVAEASREIRRHINTPGKPYGETAGLWEAGEEAHDDEPYDPYRVEPTGVILSGYVVSYDQAEHYTTYGAAVTVAVTTGGTVTGVVLDREHRREITRALDTAGVEYRPTTY